MEELYVFCFLVLLSCLLNTLTIYCFLFSVILLANQRVTNTISASVLSLTLRVREFFDDSRVNDSRVNWY